jgi:type II secretory ATPase GspE/PulE/Tfp pilus assembly ATPase PilB-like protein
VPAAEAEALRAQFELSATQALHLHRGRGCRQCQGTGYRGRTGIFELMKVTEGVRSLILDRASAGVIRPTALKQGMQSLRTDGWRLVMGGRTTIEEVLRVTKDEALVAEEVEMTNDRNE